MSTGLFVFTHHAFTSTTPQMRIALPNKGRLADGARELFTDAGLDVRVAGARALTASLGGMFEAIFVRAEDIPEFVCDGAAELGVTGLDLVAESGRDVECLLDLEFGRCRLVVAAREDSGIASLDDLPAGARVATAFPNTTRRFFSDLGRSVAVVPVSGAAEIAPHLGIADVIVDLVSTGSTLRVNGLRELETVCTSTARLVAARTPRAEHSADVRGLVAALESVIRAKGQRYVMANVPRARLADARRVLPGINGPTVVDVLNGGDHVALHAVVREDRVYHTIGELRAIGATGVLVTRIERFVP
jgi:ATP phosphoribosyltransferase